MPEFLVTFDDIKADDTIAIQDTQKRKKPLALGDYVKTVDIEGNACFGFIERLDAQCGLLWVALDRKTWASVVRA